MVKYLFKIYTLMAKSKGEPPQILIEATNLDNMTPFMLAVENMNNDIMEYLITEGLCSVFNWNANLQNWLHLAVMNRDIKTICMLLCFDSDTGTLVRGKDSADKLPIDYADKDWAILLKAEEFRESKVYFTIFIVAAAPKPNENKK